MEYVKNASRLVFTEECVDQYFTKLNFLHAECFKATLSKALGIGIIAGSLMVKVPQVVKIFNNKSGAGINMISIFLDLFAITAMGSYSFVSGFPFSAWGDAVFLGIQTLAIAILCMHYNGDTTKATAFLCGYTGILFAVITGMTPLKVLWACQNMVIPIVLMSKLFQAHTNYKNGSTGQLSAITCLMLFFGALARIFTSYQETGDMSMIILYVASTFANGIIVAQLFYYWNTGKSIKTSKNKKKISKKMK